MSMPYTLLPPISNDPQVVEWMTLGTESYQSKNLDKAERNYCRALRLEPCNPNANNNLAIILACKGNLQDALLATERAQLFDGVEPCIAANLALVYFEQERMEAARAMTEKAVSLAQERPAKSEEFAEIGYLRSRLAYAVVSASYGKPGDAIPMYNEMLDVEPTNPAAGPNSCFVQTLIDITPKELAEQRKRWYEANRWKGKYWPHGNTKHPDRTLRVGYVSGDYKSHSAAMIFANVLLNHDHESVQPYLYCTSPVEPEKDDMTQKLMACGVWRDVTAKTDEEFEDIITADKIDILVDLAGHTNGGRLALFTRRPAPIQVTAWGFAHGTGLPEIDYFFADPVAVPQSERHHFAEQIYDLPCIVTYRVPKEYGIPDTSPMPFKRNDYFTFGSFSRFEKMSDEFLKCCGEILRQVPNSRLHLKDHSFRRPYSIRRVMEAMPHVAKNRLIFGVSTSHPDHMLAYQQSDMVLDPFPHGAGNVALEVLYCGVPLLTRYGKQPSGRTASSVLTLMGRKDWIALDADDYVEKAVEWAGRVDELSAARKTLRTEIMESPVIKGYVSAVEAAYRSMFRKWCEQGSSRDANINTRPTRDVEGEHSREYGSDSARPPVLRASDQHASE